MSDPLTGPCPACGSALVRPAFRASGASFVRCRSCKSIFDACPFSEEQMAALYDGPEYFVKDPADPGGSGNGYVEDYLADRVHIEAKFDRVLAQLERYVEPGRLLDVGAGPGFLLAVAERRGWDAVGLDLNPWAAAHARDEVGVDVQVGALEAGRFPPGSFDAITMMDVVEHVPDPSALLSVASALVRPEGALVVLTPDAGAPVSRLMGRRWPEVRMRGEHPVLFSRAGLTSALADHGFVASGWHPIGKTTQLRTLAADLAAASPAIGSGLRRMLAGRPIGDKVVEVDPHTKVCVYARRAPDAVARATHRPGRVPKRPEALADVDEAILEELESLAASTRYCDWLFSTFAAHVPGSVVLEVGAGIGTFSQRMLDAGAERLLLLEPERACAQVLKERFANDPRVELTTDLLPGSPDVRGRAGSFDLVVCQNVLEHIADDRGAVVDMATALRPGGRVALVVPAGPKNFGALDDAYGHWRRYSEEAVRSVIASTDLVVEELRPMNLLGVAAWWLKNRRAGARVDATSMQAYELVVAALRPVEERFRPPVGLSLVCLARKPAH